MASSDVQITSNAFVEKGPAIFMQNLIAWKLREQGIQIRTNVNAPQALTKLSGTGAPRPYRSDDDFSGNGAKYTDRVITAHQSKWDFPFDYEDFRNTYLAVQEQNGPYYQEALNFLSEKFLEYLLTDTVYNGVRDGSGDAPEDITNGWGTIIAAEILASNLTPVVTGSLATDAEAKVKLQARSVPLALRGKKTITFCSFTSFDYYADDYASNHGYQFKPDVTGDYRIDNTNSILRPVEWMGTSGRLITTLENNLVFGTDKERVAVYTTPHLNIIKTRLMMPVGCEIQDLEALVVNDQA